MTIKELTERLKTASQKIQFEEVMRIITDHYDYVAVRFTNGTGATQVVNEPGQNEGSCKVFAFGQINQLSENQTLACFGEHYRDVLADPGGDSHANIRAFMRSGWSGIHFDGTSLTPKAER